MRLEITNSKGEQLHAVLELPAGQQPRQFAIFAHCFTCNSDFGPVRNISRELANHGFGVVRFDFTGLGRSEGDFSDTNFSANVEDLVEVSAYLEKHYQAPTLLVGHSLGGAAVLMASAQLPAIQAVAVIGAPAEAAHVAHLFQEDLPEIQARGAALVDIGGRPFTIKQQFVDDIKSNQVLEVVKKLRKPLLILHSPQDAIVEIENAAKLYQAAFHPKSFVSLDGADHLLSKRDDSNYVAAVIGTWVGRYLERPAEEPLSTRGEQVAAHLHLENKFTTKLSNGRHAILADEPPKVGGDDLGFSPYELLNASLGACTTMTLKMYAERKGWPLQDVYVYLTYARKHADDINLDNGKMGMVNHIAKKIELVGDLDETQRQRLIEIAAKCPVHRTLAESVVIETEEVSGTEG
jgi:putative redox protein